MTELVRTGDGSNTLFNARFGEHYHSKHGALAESKHVFLEAGLKYALESQTIDRISILEVGFGTGLNFLLSADYCLMNGVPLTYSAVEAFPLTTETLKGTGYDHYVPDVLWQGLLNGYEEALTSCVTISKTVDLSIAVMDVKAFRSDKTYQLVYFDAFSAIHQPELWTREILATVTANLVPGGIFVTYAITGELKRIMKSLGFRIEKLPGAPGKREMLRAER